MERRYPSKHPMSTLKLYIGRINNLSKLFLEKATVSKCWFKFLWKNPVLAPPKNSLETKDACWFRIMIATFQVLRWWKVLKISAVQTNKLRKTKWLQSFKYYIKQKKERKKEIMGREEGNERKIILHGSCEHWAVKWKMQCTEREGERESENS